MKELDQEAGLAYAGEDEETYQEVLGIYVEMHEEMEMALKDALAAEDCVAYRIAAHSVKSNSRSIGAAHVGSLAEELEHAARDGMLDVLKQKTPMLLTSYATACSEAATLLE
jgi:HPt (histidine-containing phosphotransfer) domain-containing protein